MLGICIHISVDGPLSGVSHWFIIKVRKKDFNLELFIRDLYFLKQNLAIEYHNVFFPIANVIILNKHAINIDSADWINYVCYTLSN